MSTAFARPEGESDRTAPHHLSEFGTVHEVAALLLRRQCAATGATSGVAALLDDDGATLRLVASHGYDTEALDGWSSFPLDGQLPLSEAARTGSTVIVAAPADLRDRYPAIGGTDPVTHWLVALPLVVGAHVLGAVGLRFEGLGMDHAQPRQVATAEALAGQAAEQIVAQRSLAALGEKVDQLQHALDSRVIIEQAKGLLAERHGLPPDAAFERLRSHARANGRKLRDVAAEVVEGSLRL